MKFLAALDRIRRWQRLGRSIAAVVIALALATLLALALGLADAWLGFESAPRRALVTTLGILSGLTALGLLFTSLRFPRERSARLADTLVTDPRSPATAGLSLAGTKPESDLAAYLTLRALDDSSTALSALPASRLLPWKSIRRAALALVVVLIPIGVLATIFPSATRTIAHRLLHPAADLPPWSPLDFRIDPAAPSVVYGGSLTISAEITGGDLAQPVECLVRSSRSSEIQRLPAFRESATRFSRTLEGVTDPIAIAFACGRARSAWLPVEILLQPKILAGQVTITPPAYTGLPASTTALDSNEISAPEGSTLALELTSNRPLAPSTLIFTPASQPGIDATPEEIPGEVTAVESIRFTFVVTRTGTLAATLADVRGTPAASPLEITLRVRPDQAPVVDLSSPPALLLATPSSRIPLAGTAEDDNALSRVQFVRTLQGFRDRARLVAPKLREKQYQFQDAIDLATLGVSPGQTIELFLEASDHNPSLLGHGTSGISRIQIISEEDYAERIRAQTTLEQFSARYRAIREALDRANQALDEMDKAADVNDPEKTEAARQAAAEAHREAAEMLEKLAKDFPAFEIEKRLKEIAAQQASNARQNLEALEKFDPKASEGDQRRAIREMRERLGRGKPELDALQQDAAILAEAGKVLEMAAKFQQIYANQQSLAQRIVQISKEISKGNDENRRLLPSLGETQKKNREALDAFARDLRKHAEALENPALAPLKASSLDFLERLALADPGSVMDEATASARLGQANDAFVSAELARGLLETLMNQPDPFCQACQGKSPKFEVMRPDVNQTMKQMLEGLMCQNAGSQPNNGMGGGGVGMGGTGPTGAAQPGFSMLDLPVVGPERMFFTPESTQAGKGGSAQTSPQKPVDEAAETEDFQPGDLQHTTPVAPDLEAVPPAYRDAVKAYFTPEE